MFGIGEAVTAGLKVLDKFIPDPELKAKMEAELRKGLLEADKAQIAVNKAFAMHFVGIPVMQIAAIYLDFTPPLLSFDMESLLTVMMGMLGLGGMRTYEKMKGVAK